MLKVDIQKLILSASVHPYFGRGKVGPPPLLLPLSHSLEGIRACSPLKIWDQIALCRGTVFQ